MAKGMIRSAFIERMSLIDLEKQGGVGRKGPLYGMTGGKLRRWAVHHPCLGMTTVF